MSGGRPRRLVWPSRENSLAIYIKNLRNAQSSNPTDGILFERNNVEECRGTPLKNQTPKFPPMMRERVYNFIFNYPCFHLLYSFFPKAFHKKSSIPVCVCACVCVCVCVCVWCFCVFHGEHWFFLYNQKKHVKMLFLKITEIQSLLLPEPQGKESKHCPRWREQKAVTMGRSFLTFQLYAASKNSCTLWVFSECPGLV